MNQRLLNRLVAHATGESRSTIDQLGFSIADPLESAFDPEPSSFEIDRFEFDRFEFVRLEADHFEPDLFETSPLDKFLDWDEVDARRYALANCY